MLALNHAATGAIIALKVGNPVLALPLAFASHFVLDTFPHFGYKEGGLDKALKHRLTYFAVGMDALGGLILLCLLWEAPAVAFAGGVFAVLPDLYNIVRVFVLQKGKELSLNQLNRFTQFHKKIQWCERPWGLIVDLTYFVMAAFVIVSLV